jgi:mannosyltransferase OCH1-like enzyme
MIPKIIWQTYECGYDELPEYIKDCTKTWIDQNPGWDYKYLDAKERETFVLDNFGYEWHSIFTKLPYGVLKADIWRHMVMYTHGGIYSDVDTVCKGPIDLWIKDYMNTTYFVDDDYINFCQFVLSSTPNNIIYKKILDLIKYKLTNKEIVEKFLNKKIQSFEENLTGSIICTEAIRSFLEIPDSFSLVEDYEKIKDLKTLKDNKFFYYGKESYTMLHNYPVKHLVGSNNWNDEDYIKWQKHDSIKEGFL